MAGFYLAWKLGGLTAGIITATVVALAIEWYERRHGRRGALALVSAAFVVIQGVVGLVADSAIVYLAQPVIVSAIWGLANLVSAAIGRPLMGVFADAWYPFPDFVKASRTYRRVFGFESVVWGLYLVARSGIRMLVLWTGSIGAFVAIQFVTGIPLIVGLVIWSLWYARARLRAQHRVGRRAAAAADCFRLPWRKPRPDEDRRRHRLRPERARRRDRAARAPGMDVEVREAADEPGGGVRSAELTLPGFVHDVCSGVHPLARASRRLRGHRGRVGAAGRCRSRIPSTTGRPSSSTARWMGLPRRSAPDGDAYRRLIGPFVDAWLDIARLRPVASLRAARPRRRSTRRWPRRAALARKRFAESARGRSSPATRRIRCCRWNAGRPPASRSRC